MGNAKYIMVGCALSLAACGGGVEAHEQDAQVTQDMPVSGAPSELSFTSEIDARKSLAVTEQTILARFSFQRVMNQLVAQARIPGLTATQLFQQWWDTQNPMNDANASAPHCDSEIDERFGTSLNGYPYSCREAPAEGSQAACDPFKDDACKYIPVGLFNRFDLAPESGSNCGTYSIAFAKASGQNDAFDRNLMVFEAVLPNPQPTKGLEGCRAIVNFWADLSTVNSLNERARRLDRFYFSGLDWRTRPVVDMRNYGGNTQSLGQVRTNQFMQADQRTWSLREFKLERTCQTANLKTTCTLQFVPTTDKSNPFGDLFSPVSELPQAPAFQSYFLTQLGSLSATNLNDIGMDVPEQFNAGESQASNSTESYLAVNYAGGEAFGDAIQQKLSDGGSNLEAMDMIERAQTQTCAGCHQLSNGIYLGGDLSWPSSLRNTHVSETEPETVDGVLRFRISEALETMFLPHRKDVMEQFLKGQYVPSGKPSVGGRSSH
jgi:hypothetical protein